DKPRRSLLAVAIATSVLHPLRAVPSALAPYPAPTAAESGRPVASLPRYETAIPPGPPADLPRRARSCVSYGPPPAGGRRAWRSPKPARAAPPRPASAPATGPWIAY